jgi:hypothetical protein
MEIISLRVPPSVFLPWPNMVAVEHHFLNGYVTVSVPIDELRICGSRIPMASTVVLKSFCRRVGGYLLSSAIMVSRWRGSTFICFGSGATVAPRGLLAASERCYRGICISSKP